MSDVFSTRTQNAAPCAQPMLTIGFPTAPAPGTTVTLANGAVVDLVKLGQLLAQFCPGLVTSPTTVQPSAALAAEVTPTVEGAPMALPTVETLQQLQSGPVFTAQTTSPGVTQAVTTLQPGMFGKAQQTFNPVLMNMIGQLMAQVAFRNRFDLRDGPGPDQMMLAALLGL